MQRRAPVFVKTNHFMGMKLYCSNRDKLSFEILESKCDLGNQPTPINVLHLRISYIKGGTQYAANERSYLFSHFIQKFSAAPTL